jgi:hypothetical protein
VAGASVSGPGRTVQEAAAAREADPLAAGPADAD